MLAAHQYNTDKKSPWLIWLHGLLGSAADWQPIIAHCSDHPSLVVDLPGHGDSQVFGCDSFSHFDQQLSALLQHYNIKEYYLIGYSLGARLAMHYACFQPAEGLKGLVIEGGNVGLIDNQERLARNKHDHLWAQRFRQEPIEQVLKGWYQQGVFADLTPSQRQQLIALRSLNNPQRVADMLENTSLSKQPFLVDKLQQLTVPYCYFCGERDQKFRSVSQQYALPLTLIANAGHNAHRENPQSYATALHYFLSHCG
ncbi:MAG TPA: 2-succinyl-6-hydroxy-2,4-cyclohexadiene-1-carboxylate synthase [Providencia sp.]|uniref:2-succinyl-6-hydroxy-2, 4-cyclohexadiene-1-carboxylate synthase n=1 Tax=Providencia sp. TaxID=589 RepID=UPI000E810666|nr:2-succinyl-6-hydroxy-2,4-cyclohexadiene-1-carboxylate synthase [Providencia sp.]MBP6081350.1 2-succinyl-6-hydroxy-2,4-cyclohexadiene-1-carboxylate synthase [Providencia sp.]HBO24055.1 2-succinyl-6-hydroxy-2,4-cyclohexadiene-1-carboxylate synthase [Providencia sp.]